ncbi:lysozyme [Henriciella litoralis]|uniref:lysozyme n=1 Tax=Henriciella litoralis TaxID=568102 RepID=UPI000A016BE4|nr:lysozyme [Henriciella litoralis]
MTELRTSEAGLKLIMTYEGFRSHAKKLPDGRWVVGYGHTKGAREGVKISPKEALAILQEFDLPPIETALNDLLLVPVSQNEFDALASLAYNIGIDQFEASDVLAHINVGNKLKAASAMENWRKARVGARDMVVDPLVRRRADEKALFLKTTGSVPLASTSRFRPVLDNDQSMFVPAAVRNEENKPATAPKPEDETSTEAAARHVRDRLTRILGNETDETDEVEADEIDSDEIETDLTDATDDEKASVDNIRAAVSALAVDKTDDVLAVADEPVEAETETETDTESETETVDTVEPFDEDAAKDAQNDNLVVENAPDDVETAVAEDEIEAEDAELAPLAVAETIDSPVDTDPTDDKEDAVEAAEEAETVTDTEQPQSDDKDDEEVLLETTPLTADDTTLELEENETVDERGRIIIDDLKPSDVWLSEDAKEAEAKKESPLEVFIFGLLALVGAGVFAYGGAREFSLFGLQPTDESSIMAYLPPFLMLIGGILFLAMAYYCIRALFTRK